eukprot:scaffold2299_cov131-Cylindrotheca_fusiformis.AAC.22
MTDPMINNGSAELLRQAVKDQDIGKVKDILAKLNDEDIGNNILNEPDPVNGLTALIEVCVVGNATLVQLLLQAGCPAQPTPPYRHTPLRGACVAGQAHIIPILLQAGADPNATSDGHRTPLMGACFLRPSSYNTKEEEEEKEISALCVQELFKDPRTDPTIVNSYGETALDLAQQRQYNESVTMIEQALQETKWLLPLGYIQAGIPYWSNGHGRKPIPTRDDDSNCLVFEDYPTFRPNMSPEQVIQAGAFGGTYFRSIVSNINQKKKKPTTYPVGVHLEFPWWRRQYDVEKHNQLLTSDTYQKHINKYGVKSGNDLEFWEQKGWMREQDPYGWFQWYCRFYLGRRTDDDDRQVSRWNKAIGTKGRWRTFLVGQCVKSNKTWDDVSVSPVTRQTLLHWGYELTKEDFDALAPAIQNGKSVIYMGVVVENNNEDDDKKNQTWKSEGDGETTECNRRTKRQKEN